MSILVTGGAGFIGSHLVERLLKETDAQIVVCDDFNDYYEPALKRRNAARWNDDSRVTVIEGNLCEAGFADHAVVRGGANAVIHLAAWPGVRYSVEQPRPYIENNVTGTLHLLEAARHRQVKRFVFASSSTVYGKGASAPFHENAPTGIPTSPYGVSKRAGELLCENYFSLHNVPIVTLRLFSVYGPRLRPDLAMTIFTEKILKQQPITLFGDGSAQRDFTHVADICSGIIAALETSEAVGQTINLGNDQPVAMKRFIQLLEEATGLQTRIEQRATRADELPLTHADISKARELLGYNPQTSLADGVGEFVDWFRRERL